MPYLECGKEEQFPINSEEQKTRKTKNFDEEKSGEKVKELKNFMESALYRTLMCRKLGGE